MERVETTDVLVIGAGLAGERCAVEAATAGLDVQLLSLVRCGSAILPSGLFQKSCAATIWKQYPQAAHVVKTVERKSLFE